MRERIRKLFRRSGAAPAPSTPATSSSQTPPPPLTRDPALPAASTPIADIMATEAAPITPASATSPAPSTARAAALPASEATTTTPARTWPAPQPLTERERQRRLRDRGYFGEEVWGVSARQRGAMVDEARLARHGLPVLRTEGELAAWLGIPLSRLRWYTHDRAAETTWHYVRYAVPKRNGSGERVILAPRRELKALQRKVLVGIAARVPVTGSTHGFVAGRSILTNARVHVGKRVVLRLDLKDFFPSVTYPRVRGQFIALGYPFAVAAALALLCTEYDRQPFERDGMRYYVSIGPRHLVQGAPTSPALANLVAWRMDRRLGGLGTKRGFTYTRYADDLIFSGEDAEAANRLRATAQRIISDERFTVNTAKTRLARRSARQLVTGLVVNEAPATPRALRRRLRAILHNAERTGLEAQNRDAHAHYAAHLQGMIAFVQAANPQHAAPLRAALQRVTSGAGGE